MFRGLLQAGGFQQTLATRWGAPAAVLPPLSSPHTLALNYSSPGVPQSWQGAFWGAGVSHCCAKGRISQAGGAKFLFCALFPSGYVLVTVVWVAAWWCRPGIC